MLYKYSLENMACNKYAVLFIIIFIVMIGGELHIERLYLFCLMWSYGGLLSLKEQKGFNELLATLSTA